MSNKTLDQRAIYREAIKQAAVKLNPRRQIGNPVMFLVEVGSLLLTLMLILPRHWPRGAARRKRPVCGTPRPIPNRRSWPRPTPVQPTPL